MSIKYGESFARFVVCPCGELGPTGELWGTEAGAQTSACDAAKAEGWLVTGSIALCRACYCVDCEKPNRECECDPTPYETGEPDNLPREAQERAAESMRMKR